MPTREAEGQDKQFKCEKCGATFTDPKMLENHRKVHIGAGAQGAQGRDVDILPAKQPDESPPPKPPSPKPEPSPSPAPHPLRSA